MTQNNKMGKCGIQQTDLEEDPVANLCGDSSVSNCQHLRGFM